jgi:CubicO group peptidase (beta-lactamase class C family)
MTTISLGASEPKSKVELNGASIILKDQLYTNEKEQMMCPLRELAEKLGYQITWNGADKSITLSRGSEVIKLKIGETSINVNGVGMNMGSAAVVKGDKTFVPLELFSNAMNLVVGLDKKSQSLKINQSSENTEEYFKLSENKTIQDKLDQYMQALEKYQNFHGSVLVAKGGKVLLDKGYGFSDFQQKTKNKSQTKFAIGSVTKQFTAMAIMQLSEKGMLNVEDKVSKYFPDFPNGDLITIHNLLTHTSGLVNYTDLKEFMNLAPDNQNPTEVLNLIKDKPLEFKPGEKAKYCNTGYVLLGMIVEKVSGMSYEEYLQKNIFTPLSMKDTGICYGENNIVPDATPYVGYLEVTPIDDEIVLRQTYGAGSICSTVEDLYRWDRALKTEQLVKKETSEKIFTKHTNIPGAGDYGYGWFIADTAIGEEIWHNGLTFGFTANIARFKDEDITIIILTNNRLYDTTSLTDTLTSITLNKEYGMPEIMKEIKIDDPNLYNSYVGEYDLGSGVHITITKKDDHIYAQVTGQTECEIFPQTQSKFFYKIADARIEFVSNEKGEVTEIIFEQNGIKMVAKNIKYKEEKVMATVDPKIYDEYVGEYELIPGMSIAITKENNRIYAQVTGQDKYEIFPMSEKDYFYKVVDAEISFVKDEKGQVTNLVLHQNGQDMPAHKIK